MRSSACHGVRSNEMTAELEQLGLRGEQAAAIAQVYTAHFDRLTDRLKEASLRVSKLKRCQVDKLTPGRYSVFVESTHTETGDVSTQFTLDRVQAISLLNGTELCIFNVTTDHHRMIRTYLHSILRNLSH
ncbi:hypothetical protein AAG570_003008 [Ranatra chinensis]|uniref:Uncharacterized protein n=1 Tax=Ranatra chinensis TaxID=642074 RepID=A0ABD0Y5J0_9HEMI